MTSLVAQMVKRLPTMWDTQVQSLGQKDLLEKEMVTDSSILAWKNPMDNTERLHVHFHLSIFFFFLALLGLHCCAWAFSSPGEQRLLSSCSVQASHCGGFSYCVAWALECAGFSSCSTQGW